MVQAEAVSRLEVELCTKMYGPRSEPTAFAMYRLACGLSELPGGHRVDEARSLLQEATANLEEKLGKDHKVVLDAKVKAASLAKRSFAADGCGLHRCCG